MSKRPTVAVIEPQKSDQQLQQSLSNLNTCESESRPLPRPPRTAMGGMIRSNAVSQQDVDNAVGTYNRQQGDC